MLMEIDSLVAYLPLRVVETHRKKTILGNDYVSISACVCTRITIDLDFGAGRVAYWSNQVANQHLQRGQISSQILQGFMQLSTEKQQLKVWLAEYLLIKDGSTLKRDMRFSKIEALLHKLNLLTEQAQQHSLTVQDFSEINQQNQGNLPV